MVVQLYKEKGARATHAGSDNTIRVYEKMLRVQNIL